MPSLAPSPCAMAESVLLTFRPPGAPHAISRAARSAGADVRAALPELAKRATSPPCRDGVTSALPAHERGAHPVTGT